MWRDIVHPTKIPCDETSFTADIVHPMWRDIDQPLRVLAM